MNLESWVGVVCGNINVAKVYISDIRLGGERERERREGRTDGGKEGGRVGISCGRF